MSKLFIIITCFIVNYQN